MTVVSASPRRFASLRAQGVRFLISGALNTGATFVLYWILLAWVEYRVAYTLAYVTGIALAYLLSSRYVFKVRASARSAVLFPLVYVVQYLLGLLILWIWTDQLGLPAQYGVIASVALTIPATFALSKRILRA